MLKKLRIIQKLVDANEEPLELFRQCYRVHDYAHGNRPVKTMPCGSCAVPDTPKALYRLLYLLQPEHPIDFSQMYKSGSIVEVCSPDYQFCAAVQFFKYELGIYFHCTGEHHNGEFPFLTAGWPGADNGQECTSDIGNLWYKTLIKCLTHEITIYPGNDFVV
jgi:hypothetical protein